MVLAKPMKNKGQATVEAVFGFGGSLFLLILLLYLTGATCLKLLVDHFTYEYAICRSSYPFHIPVCQRELERQLKTIWPAGQFRFEYQHHSDIRMTGSLDFFNKKIHFNHTLPWPP